MPDQIGYFASLKSAAGKVFAYLASITLTGTDGKTITVTQNTSLDEAVAMSSKLTIPGAWTTPAFNAGNFSGSASMTWTVEAGDRITYAYSKSGKVYHFMFEIATSVVGGTVDSNLIIIFPGGVTATKKTRTPISYRDNGTPGIGYALIYAGVTYARLYKSDNSNWTLSPTGLTEIYGQLTFEVN